MSDEYFENTNPCKEINLGNHQNIIFSRTSVSKRTKDALYSLSKYKKGDEVIYELAEDFLKVQRVDIKCIVEKVNINFNGELEYVLVNEHYTPGPFRFLAAEKELKPLKYNRRKLNL